MKNKLITLTFMVSLLGIFANYNYKTESKKQMDFVVMKKSQKINTYNLTLQEKTMFFSSQDYQNCNRNDLLTYLFNGGIIINDISIDSKIIKELYDIDTLLNNYNSYVFFNGYSFDVTYFSIGYINEDNQVTLSNNNYTQYVDDIIIEVEKKLNEEQIMALDTSARIYDNSIQHFVYLNGSTKMCTYTYKVQIVRNSSSSSTGDYKANSIITIVPESKYSIKNYSLNVGLNTNLTLASNSHTDYGVDQTITENKINDREIQINSKVNSSHYGIQMGFSEVLNFKSNNELNTSSLWTCINSLEVKDNGWWLFQKSYSITNENKKKLLINWNNNGFLSQEITTL